MIDSIYKTVLTIINKENQGYCSPVEFNNVSKLAQDEIFNSYFEDESRDKTRKNRGNSFRGHSNLDYNTRQKINIFGNVKNVTKNDDHFIIPDDNYKINDNGITFKGTVVEEIEGENSGYLNNSMSKPTVNFPVYEMIGNKLYVSPEIIDIISIKYTRKPKNPQWTYFTLPSGGEMFDPSNGAYQDFEIHSSEYVNLVIKICKYLGLSVREEEVVNNMDAIDKNNFIKDNQ